MVLVKEVNQPLMIYDKKQQQVSEDKMWDYVSCPYLHRNLPEEYNMFLIIIKLKVYFLKILKKLKNWS